ncbi:MAG TPA: DUF4197 domain-containing protein [Verrucomicrobiae bacterium]
MRNILIATFWLLNVMAFQVNAQTNSSKLGGLLKGFITSSNVTSSVGADQIAAGLKEALAKGTDQAVKRLGTTNGFLTNALVRIPMPAELKQVETSLRRLKQDHLADEFVNTMNRAAEKAVPLAAPVFAEAVKKMTIDDAKNILNGPKDAATQYFSKATRETLLAHFQPMVKQATDQVGLTASYKQLTDRAKVLSPFMKTQALDLDSYVTNKALDGLFAMVAQEEEKIRQDPAARTTDLLKKVFGSTAGK